MSIDFPFPPIGAEAPPPTPARVYTSEERADGVAKARLVASIAEVYAGRPPYADDEAYVAFVCGRAALSALPDYAAESYCEQHADKTVAQLEQELADAIEAAQDAGAPDLPTPTVDGVPQSITPAQGEAQLQIEGLLEMVLGYIARLPQTDPMSIAYRRALSWDRQSPSLIAMLGMLGKDAAAADAFFTAAAQIRL